MNKRGRPRESNLSFNVLAKRYRETATSTASPLIARKQTNDEVESNYFEQFHKYRNNPVAYISEILKINLWQKQREVCEALINHGQVCVRSSHLVGKSYLLGALINWAFDSYNPLGGVVSAPTKTLLTDVAFGNARALRKTADYWRGEAAPRIESNPDHYVTGITVRDPTSIQGRHKPNTFLAIDEATGVDAEIFEAIESLYEGQFKCWVNLYNPTDVSSAIATYEKQPNWHLIKISALEHPNMIAGVEMLKHGIELPPPIPGAITLERFEQLLINWSEEILESQYDSTTDIILPSTSFTDNPRFFRPGPVAQGRLLARWPSQAVNHVFSEPVVELGSKDIPQIKNPILSFGVDVARYGDDFSAITVKYGNRIVEIYEVNGYSTTQLSRKVVDMINYYSNYYEEPSKLIPIGIDGIGVGSGVVDILSDGGYDVHDINASSSAGNPDKYANKRAEMWFETQQLLKNRQLTFCDLPLETKESLSKQLLAVKYKYSKPHGKFLLVPKEETKKITKRSPDTGDSVMLAVYVSEEFSNNMTFA